MYTTFPPVPFLSRNYTHVWCLFRASAQGRLLKMGCRCIYPRQTCFRLGRLPLAPATNNVNDVQKGVGSARRSSLSFQPWVPSKVSLFSLSLYHPLPPPPMIGAAAPFTRSVIHCSVSPSPYPPRGHQLVTDRFALANGSGPACNTDDRKYCGGTYQGVISHLDYIQNMGFDAIWVSPIVSNFEGASAYGEAYHGFVPPLHRDKAA